ncbi:hypothetical protein [Burkholderia multivorans]|uniref:hypothetical protein n=1 Tax=Burkholderia multivorans TaxID=87883 RepID=UPI0020B3E354|nr:hypothetical protein [Burkholderia multivorans]
MNDQQQSRADTLTDAAALAMYEKASIAASEFDSVEAAHVAFVSSILAASPVERRAAAPIARVQVCGDEITLSATSDQRAVLMTMHDAPIYAEPPAATSANETGAEGAKPVAWFIDWPDEPELGHYFAEEPCDPKYGRSRALGFIESRSPAMAAAAPADELTDAEIWRMWNSIGQNVSATRPILFARALLSRRAAAPASSHETRAEGCNDLNERAHLAAGQWANANTPISEALAYRDGYIAGAHCGAMAAAAPAADKRDAVPKWIFDQMVDTLTPA